MPERDKKEDDSTSEEVPARQPTDKDDDKAKKDEAVDEASEQSMDGSDPPAW